MHHNNTWHRGSGIVVPFDYPKAAWTVAWIYPRFETCKKISSVFLTPPQNRPSVSIVNAASNLSRMQSLHESQHEENNERMQSLPGRRLLQLSRFFVSIGVKLVHASGLPISPLYCLPFSDGGLPLGDRSRRPMTAKSGQALVGNGCPPSF